MLDPERSVLLVQYARSTGQRFWAVPGGGLEDDESFAQAAVREAREELGLILGDAPPFAWAGSAEFEAGGSWIHQVEQFFVLNVPAGWRPEGVEEAHRKEGIVTCRWWTIDQVKNSTDPVFPEDLVQRIDALGLKSVP